MHLFSTDFHSSPTALQEGACMEGVAHSLLGPPFRRLSLFSSPAPGSPILGPTHYGTTTTTTTTGATTKTTKTTKPTQTLMTTTPCRRPPCTRSPSSRQRPAGDGTLNTPFRPRHRHTHGPFCRSVGSGRPGDSRRRRLSVRGRRNGCGRSICTWCGVIWWRSEREKERGRRARRVVLLVWSGDHFGGLGRLDRVSDGGLGREGG